MKLARHCQKLIALLTLTIEKKLSQIGRMTTAQRIDISCGTQGCEILLYKRVRGQLIPIKPQNLRVICLMNDVNRLLIKLGKIIGATGGITGSCFRIRGKVLYNCRFAYLRRFRFPI